MRRASNAQEIVFENPTRDVAEKTLHPGLMSSIRCVPATGEGVGRSDTLTNVHASEAAFWSNMEDTLDALLQAVPDNPDTAVIIETTPNGFNSFKKFWDDTIAGKTGFTPIFFPWYEDPDYRKPVPPGTEWTNEEKQLKEAYGLDDEQLSLRRWCIASKLRGDEEKFKQEYPSCPEEAFLFSGDPYFNVKKIILQSRMLKKELARGRFIFGTDENLRPIDIVWQEAEDGEVTIWENPEKNYPFVIGGDTAGDGSDRFTCCVINNVTAEQSAELVYSGGSEIWYTQQLYCLGKYFEDALIGVEINFSTYPERKLEEWEYPLLYMREKKDDATREVNVKKLGWRTDSTTRPHILGNLQTVVSETPEVFNSGALLDEMIRFVRNAEMRPEAAPGAHDDLVMAAAIAHYIRPQQRYTIAEEKQKTPQKLIKQLEKQRR
jgi:hypothetical protein